MTSSSTQIPLAGTTTAADYCATYGAYSNTYYQTYCANAYQTFWTWDHIAEIVGGVIGGIIVIACIAAYCKWKYDQNHPQPVIDYTQVLQQSYQNIPYPQNNFFPQNRQYVQNQYQQRPQQSSYVQPKTNQNVRQAVGNSNQHYTVAQQQLHQVNFNENMNINSSQRALNSMRQQIEDRRVENDAKGRKGFSMKDIFPPMPDIFYETYIRYYENLPIEHYPPPIPGFKYVPIDKSNKQLKQIRNEYNFEQQINSPIKQIKQEVNSPVVGLKKKIQSKQKLEPLSKKMNLNKY